MGDEPSVGDSVVPPGWNVVAARAVKKGTMSRSTRKSRDHVVIVEMFKDGPPPMGRPVFLDTRLRQRAGRIMQEFLAFAQDATEFIDKGYYAHFGCGGPAEYFQDRIGVRYRTVRRYLSILEAVERLPTQEERGHALTAMAQLGAHKAAIVAPAIGTVEEDWSVTCQLATEMTEEALQAHVNTLLGVAPRARSEERMLKWFLNRLPDDQQDWAEQVIRAAMTRVDPPTKSVVSVLLTALGLLAQDLASQGVSPFTEDGGVMSDETATINIDIDKPCKKCGQLGALPNGYCLDCAGRLILAGVARKANRAPKHR